MGSLALVAPVAAAQAAAATEESAGARIDRGLDTFYDPSASTEEIELAVQDLLQAAQGWMSGQEAPIEASAAGDARFVEEAVGFAYEYMGLWLDVPRCRGIIEQWLALVAADDDLGGHVGARLGSAVSIHADFVALIDGPVAGLALLDDETLERVALGDPIDYRRCLTVRASLCRVLGDIPGCFEDLDRWRESELDSEPSDFERYGLHLVQLQLEIDLGRMERAGYHAKEIRNLLAKDPDIDHAASADLIIGSFMAASGNYESARGMLGSAVDEYPPHEAWTRRGKRLIQDLKLAESIAILRTANQKDEELLGRAETWLAELTGETGPLESTRRMVAAVERADLLLRLDRADEARELLEDSADGLREDARSTVFEMRFAERRYDVARALGDEELREAAAEDLSRAVEGMFESWSELDLLPGGVGFLHYGGRRRTIALLVDEILRDEENGKEDALDLVLRADSFATLARRLGAPTVTSARLQAFCKRSDSAVVVLLTSRDVTHRFLVTASGVSHAWCAGAEELEPLLESAARIVGSPAVEAISKTGDGPLELLAQTFLPDEILKDPARFSCIHFAGVEVAGSVPLEALPTDDGALGLTVPVARMPSAAACLSIAGRARKPSKEGKPSIGMFALSGVKHGGVGIDFRPAEFPALLAAARAPIDRPAAAKSDAETFLRVATAGDDLFITWSHGRFDMRQPIPAGILVVADPNRDDSESDRRLAPDGLELLNGARIETRFASKGSGTAPRVVLLAACDTGRSHTRKIPPRSPTAGSPFLVWLLPVSQAARSTTRGAVPEPFEANRVSIRAPFKSSSPSGAS
ncbi:MAG: hypothetical protein AAF957_00535, partial [Planctomycetota bacterium]